MDYFLYHITFTNTQCVILYKTSKNLIDLADRLRDLYVLQAQAIPSPFSPLFTCNFVQILSSNLWHMRLGHPSDLVHKILSSVIPTITHSLNKYFPFHFCHLSKHRCLPYPDSNSTTSHAFSLLHVDIWGPYFTPSINNKCYFLTIVDDFTRFT